MNSDTIFSITSIAFPIQFGIFATFFLVIGLRGILTKRPFLLSNRWLLLMMFLCFIPTIIVFLLLPSTQHLIKWVNPAIFTVILVMMCFVLKGYVAYAVTDNSFREALLAALEKLQLPYEETLSSIRLTSLEADLQISVQSWVGSGIIKIKQREHRTVLTQIVTLMNEHFRLSTTDSNLTSCIFFVIMGILMVAAGVGILFFI